MDKPEFDPVKIAHLDSAYRQAVYEIHCHKIIKLRIGKHNFELEQLLNNCNSQTWALVTAFNPYSQCLSETENLQRHQNLIKHLQPLSFSIFEAWGKDELDYWTPEKGIFIVGIDLKQARKIGLKFQQNAIVYGKSGKLPQLQWL